MVASLTCLVELGVEGVQVLRRYRSQHRSFGVKTPGYWRVKGTSGPERWHVTSARCQKGLLYSGCTYEPKVYAIRGKSTHTCIVVESRVYMIDTYSIGPKVCHRGSVEGTLSSVGERVEGGKLVGNACSVVRNRHQLADEALTFDVILRSIGEEELCSNGRDGGHIHSRNNVDGC